MYILEVRKVLEDAFEKAFGWLKEGLSEDEYEELKRIALNEDFEE